MEPSQHTSESLQRTVRASHSLLCGSHHWERSSSKLLTSLCCLLVFNISLNGIKVKKIVNRLATSID